MTPIASSTCVYIYVILYFYFKNKYKVSQFGVCISFIILQLYFVNTKKGLVKY